MHQTHKYDLTKVQMFDEEFAQEQTSSNSIKHDFFKIMVHGSSNVHND